MRRELSDALEAGALAGYDPAPPRGGWGGATVDAEVCRDATCPACGRRGLDYHPYTRGGSYRAFAVCPACGYEEEF